MVLGREPLRAESRATVDSAPSLREMKEWTDRSSRFIRTRMRITHQN
jgi:hypothetical protein